MNLRKWHQVPSTKHFSFINIIYKSNIKPFTQLTKSAVSHLQLVQNAAERLLMEITEGHTICQIYIHYYNLKVTFKIHSSISPAHLKKNIY